MNTDRRLSLRTRVDLPFAWLRLAEPQSAAMLCESFKLPAFVQLQGRLSDLDIELDHVLHNISDSSVIGALRLLDAKLDLLCEAQQVSVTVPDWKSIELSTDGIGFETRETLTSGSWIGIHLVLRSPSSSTWPTRRSTSPTRSPNATSSPSPRSRTSTAGPCWP